MIRVHDLSVALPGLRAFRWVSDALATSIKSAYVVGRVEQGRSEYRTLGKRWVASPGTLVLKQPGDAHRDLAADGSVAYQVVVLPAAMVEAVAPRLRVAPQLAANDERAAPLHRLHDAIAQHAGRLVLEVALVEAVAAFVELRAPAPSRAIRRAVELLRARVAEPVTLEALATEVGLDKFHLCHAFRTQVGVPPYAYLTQLRIQRAQALLGAGTPPRDVAMQVGFYDQSQLNRHFRRLVGVTPGAYRARR